MKSGVDRSRVVSEKCYMNRVVQMKRCAREVDIEVHDMQQSKRRMFCEVSPCAQNV